MNDGDPISDLREETDDLFLMAANLPDDETVRLRADRVRRLCDLFAQVMDDAIETAENAKAMRTTIDVGDAIIGRLTGLNPKEPIL